MSGQAPALLRRLLRIVAIMVLTMAAHAAMAQDFRFNGTYAIDEKASDNVAAKIEIVVDEMNLFIRPIARSRLINANIPRRRLVISSTIAAVSIKADDQDAIVTPANGDEVPVVTSGDSATVRTVSQGDNLVRTFRNDGGQRANTYSLDPSGNTLILDVKVTSARLPRVLTYRLVYRRVAAAP